MGYSAASKIEAHKVSGPGKPLENGPAAPPQVPTKTGLQATKTLTVPTTPTKTTATKTMSASSQDMGVQPVNDPTLADFVKKAQEMPPVDQSNQVSAHQAGTQPRSTQPELEAQPYNDRQTLVELNRQLYNMHEMDPAREELSRRIKDMTMRFEVGLPLTPVQAQAMPVATLEPVGQPPQASIPTTPVEPPTQVQPELEAQPVQPDVSELIDMTRDELIARWRTMSPQEAARESRALNMKKAEMNATQPELEAQPVDTPLTLEAVHEAKIEDLNKQLQPYHERQQKELLATLGMRGILMSSPEAQRMVKELAAEQSERLDSLALDLVEKEQQQVQKNLDEQMALVEAGRISGDQAVQVLRDKGIEPESYMTQYDLDIYRDSEELKSKLNNMTNVPQEIKDQIDSLEELDYFVNNDGQTYEDMFNKLIEGKKTVEEWKAKIPSLQDAKKRWQHSIDKKNKAFMFKDQDGIDEYKAKIKIVNRIIDIINDGGVPDPSLLSSVGA